jgi:hypothetical protein
MRDARPVPTSSRPVPGTGKPDRFPVPSYREPEPGTGRGTHSKETLGNQSGNRSDVLDEVARALAAVERVLARRDRGGAR